MSSKAFHFNTFRFLFQATVLIEFSFLLIAGCDALFTEPVPEGEAFDQPLPGLTRAQNLAFLRGDEAFEKSFSVAEGLGPIFNQPSCESCHSGDGKGHPRTNLIRFGLNTGTSFEPLVDFGGPQLQEKSIPGVPPETLPAHANAISRRSGPMVFGLGLIEGIPDSAILALADPNDVNGDGISGRPNIVSAPSWVTESPGPYVGGKYLGRFGRKAGVAFLLQQVATAYHQDMGITSEFIPYDNPHPEHGVLGDEAPDPEVSPATVRDVVFYLQTLAPPKRGAMTPEVQRGEQVFLQIGCATCHVPSLKSGKHPTIAALSEVDVPLYSDLLLHDMGPELADNFVEGEATGTEWRTTPLWGLRLLADHLGGIPYYLHDGRTSDLREAIRLHGGEAAPARNRFLALPEGDARALIAFLMSL
ncbi:MAG TPA: di-heme oxidoredictase family protein [Bacteroidota bacterium]|nr:di-heme oxidoredictase family protein [Bacteroidota bacterium]